jgi:hypothetical protein
MWFTFDWSESYRFRQFYNQLFTFHCLGHSLADFLTRSLFLLSFGDSLYAHFEISDQQQMKFHGDVGSVEYFVLLSKYHLSYL